MIISKCIAVTYYVPFVLLKFNECLICQRSCILNQNKIDQRIHNWKKKYNDWRRGESKGSCGEINNVLSYETGDNVYHFKNIGYIFRHKRVFKGVSWFII